MKMAILRIGGKLVRMSEGEENAKSVGVGAGAALLKSISIFLMTSRKAPAESKRPTSVSAKRRQRRIMPDTANHRSYANNAKTIESLKKKTKFSWVELDRLCKLYKTLARNVGQQQVGQSVSVSRRPKSRQMPEGIDRAKFREFLHNTFDIITEDTLTERIFCCWDRDSEGLIRLEPWIMGLDLFLRGSFREKTGFCFKVYDLNNDGYITKDEILQLLKNCLIKQPGEEDPDEGVRDLSDLALKKIDVDRDGKISFTDYKTAVTEEPLLLEAFGQCLPTDKKVSEFLTFLQT